MRENVSIKAMRILVVEDNELNREIATTILSDDVQFKDDIFTY